MAKTQASLLRAAAVTSLLTAVFAFVACGGGGGGGSALPGHAQTLQLKTPLASPTPTHKADQLSTTLPLTAGTALPIPEVGGIAGSFTAAYSSAPPGTTVTMTTYDRPPAGAPAIRGGAVPVFWVSNTYSSPVVFNGLPSLLSYTLPAGFNTANSGFEIETFDGTAGSLLDYEVGSLSGSTVSLASPAVVSVVPSHTYWWELLCNGTNPINPPLSSAGQTTKLLPMCGFNNTMVTIPSNNAQPGAYLTFALVVPPYLTALSPPPGTTTGLLSIEISNTDSNVPQGVSYNSGLLAFTADVPPVISTAGKTFVVTSCSYDLVWTASGHYWTGCTDTPYVSGPLAVSGQTLSFAGVPFPISLPAMTGTDCKGLTDCVQPSYFLSVYY